MEPEYVKEEWFQRALAEEMKRRGKDCNFERVKMYRAEDFSLRQELKRIENRISEQSAIMSKYKNRLETEELPIEEQHECTLKINLAKSRLDDEKKVFQKKKDYLDLVQKILAKEENRCGMNIPSQE